MSHAGRGAVGSAPVWGTGGRRFESGRPDHVVVAQPDRAPASYWEEWQTIVRPDSPDNFNSIVIVGTYVYEGQEPDYSWVRAVGIAEPGITPTFGLVELSLTSS